MHVRRCESWRCDGGMLGQQPAGDISVERGTIDVGILERSTGIFFAECVETAWMLVVSSNSTF